MCVCMFVLAYVRACMRVCACDVCNYNYIQISPAARGVNLAKIPQTRLLLILLEEVV